MNLFFLASSLRIAKSYDLTPEGELVKHSYPFVYEFTSTEAATPTIQTFYDHVVKHAGQGHCLLKGALTRSLTSESRAGSTVPNERTDWICLDLDGVEGYQSVDLFLEDIGLGSTDYILQWSSSQGIENKSGFRCHIFMLLEKPHHPQLLKQWLSALNLQRTTLSSQLELTKTYNSLKWPLDITTCQNDKLLYIAPPNLGSGIVDPFPGNKRIELIVKSRRTATLPTIIPTKEAIRDLTNAAINNLRLKANLPKRKKFTTAYQGTIEYLKNPDQATVTDIKHERGFVYLNLNGGDSWAYYHPENNPSLILNFKGEPAYRTEELLPDYWAQLNSQASNYTPNSQGLIYLAFRDFRSGNYYNGIYDASTKNLEFAQAKSETQLRHFLKQHGQPPSAFVPDWNIVFDPHTSFIVDPDERKINIFNPSKYFIENPPKVLAIPTVCSKVISHVLGNDPASIDHFINWLACITQNLDKTGTAWVFQGTQGTGKGVMFHQIMTPLFGAENVVAKRMEEIESEFTGFMENKFIVFIDEIEAGRSLYHSKITAKLKNLIVEPTISIRKMYSPPYMARNFSNMIFASNKPIAVEIEPDDRRFNVGPYQTDKLIITSTEIDLIATELADFYAYLMQYPADTDRARTPLINDARTQLMHISRTAIDTVSDAILAGNVAFFWDLLVSNKINAPSLFTPEGKNYARFRDLVVDIVTNGTQNLSRDDLHAIYSWCVGNIPVSSNKFTALLKHHRMHLKTVWKHGRSVRGVQTTWIMDPVWLANAQQEIANDAV